ncbi:hypothetical protein HJC23_004216 [Cyclotella cryptica]|uniref:Uncharacterized protein n=1 Tax=Cyclotella cryptica TaxID=29204 RepID=A0ABD3Q7C7_9STRA
MKTLVVLAITALNLLSAAPTSAFVSTHSVKSTSTTTPSSSSCFAWKKSVQNKRRAAAKPSPKFPSGIKEFGDPESEDMKQVIDIVGMNRLKKAARKQKRVRNQLIREGAIELNEEGRWVAKGK